jgi:glutathione peroxidase-family protein
MQLNRLHDLFADRGLAILAFPCNQFGSQEPGGSNEIYEFATRTKRAKFDLFAKVDVGGPDAHPIFKLLLGGSGKDGCQDLNQDCEAWASTGECEKSTPAEDRKPNRARPSLPTCNRSFL